MFQVWLSLPEKKWNNRHKHDQRHEPLHRKEDIGKISAACDPREKQYFCGIAHRSGGCTPLPQGRASPELPPPTNAYWELSVCQGFAPRPRNTAVNKHQLPSPEHTFSGSFGWGIYCVWVSRLSKQNSFLGGLYFGPEKFQAKNSCDL